MNKLFNYRSLILDVDGVIFDSNHIKEKNIRRVASSFISGSRLSEFVEFFTKGNGIPRETKIASYFGFPSKEYDRVLEAYNDLNNETLYNVRMTKGARQFLEKYSKVSIWAVSGGAEFEIKKLFEKSRINQYFNGIHGGPKLKLDHLKRIQPLSPILYIGDSKVDYLTSREIDADFIFMSGYTQFKNWREYFQNYPDVKIIKDLTEL